MPTIEHQQQQQQQQWQYAAVSGVLPMEPIPEEDDYASQQSSAVQSPLHSAAVDAAKKPPPVASSSPLKKSAKNVPKTQQQQQKQPPPLLLNGHHKPPPPPLPRPSSAASPSSPPASAKKTAAGSPPSPPTTTTTTSPKTTSVQRRREVFTTEEVETLVCTLPKTEVPEELLSHLPEEEIVEDPHMAHVHLTEELASGGKHPLARGSHFSYTHTHEHLDDGNIFHQHHPPPPPLSNDGGGAFHNGMMMHGHTNSNGAYRSPPLAAHQQQMVPPPTAAAGSDDDGDWTVVDGGERRQRHEDVECQETVSTVGDLERHHTSTKKITRLTKITTTRSVRQVPVDPADMYFNADGMPATTAMMDFPDAVNGYNGYGIELSPTYITQHNGAFIGSQQQQFTPHQQFNGNMGGGKHEAREIAYNMEALPSAPGAPTIIELGADYVSLAWHQPPPGARGGGPLVGYRVEFRRSELDDWSPAHEDLLVENECKITNLDPTDVYEFRVRAANAQGFGPYSEPSQQIQATAAHYDHHHPQQQLHEQTQLAAMNGYAGVSIPAPSRPRVMTINEDHGCVVLEWAPPPFGGPYRYNVEYRVAATPAGPGSSPPLAGWLPANDRPVIECRLQVTNLRPRGHYEFRVTAIDPVEGCRSSPSLHTDPVRIETSPPPSSIRRRRFPLNTKLCSPGRPEPLELGAGWVHIRWEPSSIRYRNGDGGGERPPPLGYLVELRLVGDDEADWSALITAQGVDEGEEQEENVDGVVAGGGPNFQITTTLSDFIVENLRPESEYQFRVCTVSLLDGSQSTSSDVSEPVRIPSERPFDDAFLSSASDGKHLRKPPDTPNAPEYLDLNAGSGPSSADDATTLTLCWLPARSVLPVQGYEVEFRDRMQDAVHWYKITDQLVLACRTTIGFLIPGHQLKKEYEEGNSAGGNGVETEVEQRYQFRIRAKNSAGLSAPSDPSPPVTISQQQQQPSSAGADGAALSHYHQPRQADASHQQQHQKIPSSPGGTADDDASSPRGRYIEAERHAAVALFEECIRESPPLPDRDDSPPPIYRQQAGTLQWRDPTLKEVLDYLRGTCTDWGLVADASGYLQHLTYNNDVIKEEVTELGGIELLVALLRRPESTPVDVLRNVCGCLKNLAFGRANDGNKLRINKCGGVKALAHLLRAVDNVLVHEEATGALWNISSSDALKEPVLRQAAELVAVCAVVPSAGALVAKANTSAQQQQPTSPNNRGPSAASHAQQLISQQQNTAASRTPVSMVFRNATGVLRNISAANEQARRQLRPIPGLIDALLDALKVAIDRQQLDSRPMENVICLLRNLSYRVQEVVDARFDPNRARYDVYQRHQQLASARSADANGESATVSPTHHHSSTLLFNSARSRSAPSGSPKEGGKAADNKETKQRGSKSPGLFLRKAKKGGGGANEPLLNGHHRQPPVSGPHRLWHPDTVRLYLRVLQEATDIEILEACAAALQNLAACPFEGSVIVRATVRTENGLPILFGLLHLREDRVVGAVCTALRNLSLDPKNVEVIGRHALGDLVSLLPPPPPTTATSRASISTTQQQQRGSGTGGSSFVDPHLHHQGAEDGGGHSDVVLGAVLGILWECVRSGAQWARLVHECGGTERLRALAEPPPPPSFATASIQQQQQQTASSSSAQQRSKRIRRYSTQVLYVMWQHRELHEMFRRSGLNESHFYTATTPGAPPHSGTLRGRKHLPPPHSGPINQPSSSSDYATTLARPFSSQGAERPQQLLLHHQQQSTAGPVDASFYSTTAAAVGPGGDNGSAFYEGYAALPPVPPVNIPRARPPPPPPRLVAGECFENGHHHNAQHQRWNENGVHGGGMNGHHHQHSSVGPFIVQQQEGAYDEGDGTAAVHGDEMSVSALYTPVQKKRYDSPPSSAHHHRDDAETALLQQHATRRTPIDSWV